MRRTFKNKTLESWQCSMLGEGVWVILLRCCHWWWWWCRRIGRALKQLKRTVKNRRNAESHQSISGFDFVRLTGFCHLTHFINTFLLHKTVFVSLEICRFSETFTLATVSAVLCSGIGNSKHDIQPVVMERLQYRIIGDSTTA